MLALRVRIFGLGVIVADNDIEEAVTGVVVVGLVVLITKDDEKPTRHKSMDDCVTTEARILLFL